MNQQKKAGNHDQRIPIPTLKLVSTEGVGRGVLGNIKKFDHGHYYITEVTNDDTSHGVLLKTYTKEGKDVYDCPYCTKAGIKGSGLTNHIKHCTFVGGHCHQGKTS